MNRKYEQLPHLDADESVFFQRELEYIKSKTFDVKYAELKARRLFPLNPEADPGATEITYYQYDQAGMAKIIANYADDLPRVDIKGKKFTSPIKELGAAYGYTIKEIRSSKMANKKIDQRRANAARRAIAQAENRYAFSGDAGTGLPGFLSNPNISSVTIPADGSGASKLWSSKTPAQIIRDLNLVSNTIVSNTKGVETPDTLLLPVDKYTYIASTPRSDNSDTTILKYFLQNNPFIKNVDWVNELTGACSGGTDRLLAYRRDPDALTLEVPSDFEQLDVEKRNLEYIVDCIESFGGVIIYYPLSVCYGDGI
jgi:hypothetical protein